VRLERIPTDKSDLVERIEENWQAVSESVQRIPQGKINLAKMHTDLEDESVRAARVPKASVAEDQDNRDKPDENLIRELRGNGRELLIHLWGRGNIIRDELWRKIWAKRKITGKRKQISDEQKSKTIDRAVVYLNRRFEELGYHGYQVKHNGGLYYLNRPQK